jgi:hypothetical protein
MGPNKGEAMKTLLFIMFLLLPLSANAGSTMFTGAAYTEDAWLDYNAADTKYGATDSLRIWLSGLGHWQRAVIRLLNIDDSILSTSTIIAGTLYVWCLSEVGGENTIYANKVCKPWVEADVTYNDWAASPARGWGTAGCRTRDASTCADCWNDSDGSGDDFQADSTSVAAVATSWVKIPIDTCHWNYWLESSHKGPPAGDSLNGVVLSSVIGFASVSFSSSEGDSIPYWKVHWTDPSEAAGPVNAVHAVEGHGVVHSIEGSSVIHEP